MLKKKWKYGRYNKDKARNLKVKITVCKMKTTLDEINGKQYKRKRFI